MITTRLFGDDTALILSDFN